jgi:hypothetical protein
VICQGGNDEMKQTTAKTIKQALEWIDMNSHHIAEKEGFHFNEEIGGSVYSHLVLKGHHAKLRIPVSILKEMQEMFAPNTREFDTRMYMVTDAGRAYLETSE